MQSVSQNGQLPPPPLPGFASFPPPSVPHTPNLPAPPAAFPPPVHQSVVAASDRIQEVMDSDREDGELSEGEVGSQLPVGKGNGRANVEPPRSVPQASHLHPSPRVEEAYNPDEPAAGQAAVKASIPKQSQPAPAPSPMDTLQQKREEAKAFVKLLNSHNMGYRTLAKEDLDLELLREMYSSLNLPSEPAPIMPVKTNGNTSTKNTTTIANQPAPITHPLPPKPVSVKPSMDPSSPAKPAPPPPPPGDRKEYIARLQAAKLAKQAGGNKPISPQNTPATAAPPTQPVQAPQATLTPNAKPPVSDEQRARNTELIKQRLEALKAKGQATSKANGITVAQKDEQIPQSSQQTSQPVTSGASTPVNQSQAPFPGIPGLFMNAPPAKSDLPIPSRPVSSVPAKRSAPSDSTDASTPRGSVTPYTRPLGDSPHTYQEESMIIEVSDDDSNGSDMDIDDDQESAKAAISSSATTNQRHPGIIPNFPSQTGSAMPGSSAASTPGPQTPATQTRENELKKKESELAAMREVLRKKIAERVAKEKADKAAANTASSSSLQTPPTRSGNDGAGQGISNSTLNAAGELIRDVKRRRREEIQSELPSIEAELATNAAKMAQLTKEMNALMELNKKMATDKQRLTDELESLGIDTDGMSHAEMRAKKDEVDHERASEQDAGAQAPDLAETSANQAPTTVAEPIAQALPQTQDATASRSSVEQDASLSKVETAADSNQEMTDSSQAPTEDEPALVENVTSDHSITSEAKPAEIQAAVESLPAAPEVSPAEPQQAVTSPEDVGDDDFYGTPAADLTLNDPNTKEKDQGSDNAQSVPEHPQSEESEVEMSESSEDEEEEYEPEEPTVMPDATHAQPPGLNWREPVMAHDDDVSTEDEEAYEPPDAEEEMPGVQDNNQVPESPQVEAEDGAMDIASSSDDSDDSDSDGEVTSEAGLDDTISENHAPQRNTNVADDLAPELQPESAAPGAAPVEVRFLFYFDDFD